MQIKRKIKEIIKNFASKKGLKTKRHIVVFESDDWGADRNSSKEGLETFKKEFPNFALDGYQKFDTLESDSDVISLSETLAKHKDSKGNPAVFTLNFAVANIDFEKTAKSKELFLIAIDEYYKKFKEKKNVLDLVKKAEEQKTFFSALHTREHVNSEVLLEDLKNDEFVQKAFENGVVGVKDSYYHGMDTLNASEESLKKIIGDATSEFERIFGRKSETFIAPCYVWNYEVEKKLEKNGVKFLQGNLFHNIPTSSDSYQKKLHGFGSKSKHSNLRYFYRNCFFEPTNEREKGKLDKEILESTMCEIEKAFKAGKPAVVCSHRVNFVSGMSEQNQKQNIELLDLLLTKITEKYPDVEFLDSVSMSNEMITENV